MAPLRLEELRKRDNLNIFLNKWKNNDDFTFTTTVIGKLPPYNQGAADTLRLAVANNAHAVKAMQTAELRKILPIGKLQKTAEFGGRGSPGVPNEKFLCDALTSHMVTTPMNIIFISSKKQFLVQHVLSVKWVGKDTTGHKKADLHLVTATGSIPLSLKQGDSAVWESADTVFRVAGTHLMDALVKEKSVALDMHATAHGHNVVTLNRVVAMETTEEEQQMAVFGSDIITKKGAVIVRTFQTADVTYNMTKNRIEVQVDDIYQSLREIPAEKTPIWVIRNAETRRTALPKYPGLRTEMKIAKYVMTSKSREGRELPLIIKLNERGKYGLSASIVRNT